MAKGMENFYDGYEIVLPENPITATVISSQSRAMDALCHSANYWSFQSCQTWSYIAENKANFSINIFQIIISS